MVNGGRCARESSGTRLESAHCCKIGKELMLGSVVFMPPSREAYKRGGLTHQQVVWACPCHADQMGQITASHTADKKWG